MGFFVLISFFDISLLVYKKCLQFLSIDLYPTVLPNSLIRLSSVLVEAIRFSIYTIMSSANSDSFTSSFPIWMPFISLSDLIAVARTSNTMLNRIGEIRHHCLVPDLSGKAFSFCLFSMIWL